MEEEEEERKRAREKKSSVCELRVLRVSICVFLSVCVRVCLVTEPSGVALD